MKARLCTIAWRQTPTPRLNAPYLSNTHCSLSFPHVESDAIQREPRSLTNQQCAMTVCPVVELIRYGRSRCTGSCNSEERRAPSMRRIDLILGENNTRAMGFLSVA